MSPDLPDDLYEFHPQPTLRWPGHSRPSAPLPDLTPNLAYRRSFPLHALPDTVATWPDGVSIHRLPTVSGELRFNRVHVSTLPDGTRLATIEDVHEYHTDALTGLFDRRALNHDLRTQTPGSVTLLDIDHFKDVNDTLGHAAGDDVLCALATLLAATAAASAGYAYRLGGDEFLLHSPRPLPAGQLEHLQEQFQRAACRIGVPDGHVSMGTAHAPLDGNTFRLLILHADVQLGEHKRHGRPGAPLHADLDPDPVAPALPGWTRR